MDNYCKLRDVRLAEASFLFYKNLTLRQKILKRVDAFTTEHFSGRCVLGVHYRGTDKIYEAARVSWETCRNAINDYLYNHPEVNCLFISSDEVQFIDFILQEITSVPVCYHDDQQRSHDGRAIHSSSFGDNYIKGREALINCLLLSRCSVLIRTTSTLSAWASIVNPELPVILLNRPYRDNLWFPESAVISGPRTIVKLSDR